ncbi:MAG: ABC transporter substrate-binding protein [candidate division WOR-3 bacterium]|nr:ABC transporter substrate-binding protein [candidate division WOR-3 bacterium]
MTKLLNILIVVLAAALVFVILYPQIQQNRPINLKFACDSSATSLPILVGMDESLFAKNRIKATLVFYSDPDQALADLFAGKVDVGVFPWSTVLKRIATKGETLKVFMGEEYRQSLPVDAIVAPLKSPVKTVADIRGRRFIYPPQVRDYIPVMLTDLGMRPEDIKLSEVPFSSLTQELAAGTCDAAWLIEPLLCPLDTTQYRIVQYSALARFVFQPFPGAAIGFAPRFPQTYRQGPKRLKIATDAAMAIVETKGDLAKQVLAKYFPYSAKFSGFCRLPELQRNTEINKTAVKALALRLKLTGVPADTVNMQNIFPDPLIFSR